MRRSYAVSSGGPAPSAYTFLQYIKSNGTQIIITDYYPRYDTSLEADINLTSSSGKPYPFSCYASGMRGYLIGCETPSIAMGYGNIAFINTGYSFPIGSRKTLKASWKSGRQTMSVGGNIVKTTTHSGSFVLPTPMGIFAMNNNGSYQQYANMYLYSCKIWTGDTLVRNYRPAMRNADGKIGLYCDITDTFITDVNNRTFEYAL